MVGSGAREGASTTRARWGEVTGELGPGYTVPVDLLKNPGLYTEQNRRVLSRRGKCCD